MVLLNKAALSSFDFTSPVSLLFFQCFVCVILVKVWETAGFIKLEPFSWKIVQLWFPVNVIFVGMTWSSFAALKNLGVPMATSAQESYEPFCHCWRHDILRQAVWAVRLAHIGLDDDLSPCVGL